MTKINWDSGSIESLVKEASMRALRDVGESILTKSMNNVPLDTGTLRRSGTVTVGGPVQDPEGVYESARSPYTAKTSRGHSVPGDSQNMNDAFPDPVGPEMKVYVSYNTPYARRQHEDLSYHHTDGGPKYLENAFNEQVPKAKSYIQDYLKNALKRGSP